MAEPSSSYRQRWADLVTGRQTPRRWAVIVDAIDTADAARRNRLGEPIPRGGDDWCRLAMTALERPASDRRSGQQPDRLTDRCLADVNLIRGWLKAPTGYADNDTIAARLAIVEWTQAEAERRHRVLHRLINAGQDAGLFGVAGHRIELYQVADVDAGLEAHLVIVRANGGAGLATRPLIDGLLPGGLDDIEASVVAFRNVAAAVNATLDAHDTATDRPKLPRPFPSPTAPDTPTARRGGTTPDQTPPPAGGRSR